MSQTVQRFVFALAIVALAAGVAAGCASARGADADVTPAVPPAPAKKPFTAPTFASKEWRSEEHGFLVHYPSDFEEQEAQGPTGVLTAASPMMAPRLDVNVSPVPDPVPSLEEVATQTQQTFATLGGGEAKVTSSQMTKLQDGLTPAMELVVEWTFQGFPLQTVALQAIHGDEMVNVTVTGLQGGAIEELRNIAYTLYFP